MVSSLNLAVLLPVLSMLELARRASGFTPLHARRSRIQLPFFAATTRQTPESIQLLTSARNMFHDYDKPIVLIGCSSSSSSDELGRLANFLSKKLGDSSVVTLSSESQEALTKNNPYKWPDIMLLDLAKLGDGGKDVIETVARTVYDDGLLSIYILHQCAFELLGAGTASSKRQAGRRSLCSLLGLRDMHP